MKPSPREIFRVVAGQLSDSLKNFVGQKRKMPHKNNRVLLYSNTSLSVNTANLIENSQNTQEICAVFTHSRPSHPKYCLGIFLDYNFSLDILSGKLTKFAGHFRILSVFSDRPTDFAKTGNLSLGFPTWSDINEIQTLLEAHNNGYRNYTSSSL